LEENIGFRFGVKNESGRQSSIFRVWRGKRTSDIYVASRSIAGEIKASLHQSGSCHIALTEQYVQRPDALLLEGGDRYFSKWKRPTADTGVIRAFTIYIPTSELGPATSNIQGKKVLWLPAAAQDYAVAVELMFTMSHIQNMSWRSEEDFELPVIARMQLPNGQHLWAVYRTVSVSSHIYKPLEDVRSRIRSNPEVRLKLQSHDSTGSPMRILVMGNADDGSHFFIDASFAD
jgi:hypothetical protein